MNTDASHVKDNLNRLRDSIGECLMRSGRKDEVQVLAVTKYLQADEMLDLRQAGLDDFAENRLQPALEKLEYFSGEGAAFAPRTWHFIGHIQTNKVRKLAGRFDLLHSVDSYRLAEILDRESGSIGVTQDVLLQVNVSAEEQKHGFSQEDLFHVFPRLLEFKSIRLCGLMGMAAFGNRKGARNSFRCLSGLLEALKSEYGPGEFDQLSMGMSSDFETAVEEGATILRIGSILYS
jgi:PLP dependent protein